MLNGFDSSGTGDQCVGTLGAGRRNGGEGEDCGVEGDQRYLIANSWVGWLRAFSEPLLASALLPTIEAGRQRALLDEIYRRTTARIEREPEQAKIPWTLAVLHVAKSR